MVCFDFVELKSFHQRDAIFNIRVCFDLFGPDENLEFITKKKFLDSTWSETRPLNALKYINKIRSESVQISFQFWKFSAREIWFPGKCDYFVWKQEMKSICGHAGRLYNVYNFSLNDILVSKPVSKPKMSHSWLWHFGFETGFETKNVTLCNFFFILIFLIWSDLANFVGDQEIEWVGGAALKGGIQTFSL